jgi:hypothetical protein
VPEVGVVFLDEAVISDADACGFDSEITSTRGKYHILVFHPFLTKYQTV